MVVSHDVILCICRFNCPDTSYFAYSPEIYMNATVLPPANADLYELNTVDSSFSPLLMLIQENFDKQFVHMLQMQTNNFTSTFKCTAARTPHKNSVTK